MAGNVMMLTSGWICGQLVVSTRACVTSSPCGEASSTANLWQPGLGPVAGHQLTDRCLPHRSFTSGARERARASRRATDAVVRVRCPRLVMFGYDPVTPQPPRAATTRLPASQSAMQRPPAPRDPRRPINTCRHNVAVRRVEKGGGARNVVRWKLWREGSGGAGGECENRRM